ncbi:MAG: Gfo/Idh/MocA family oxidoreductase [Candidatus Omnitrophica bacterium]|nr:Gfo/Idh/MocA family oxidoreductase [Candidatus Omnitrophota bacterium]
MSKLKVGVVGSGHIGKFHARIYKELPDIELAKIADINPEREKVAQKLKVPFTQSYRDLIGNVDAVSIAVPTRLHYEVAREFLEAGAHVLIEKPVTATLEEADHLIEIAEKNDLVLASGHVERFNNAWLEVQKILKEPRFIEVHRLGPFQERAASCGVVLDLMIHDIDIVLNLVKSPITRTDSVGIRVLSDYEDLANARLRFESGCVANITASRLTPEPQRKIRIFQDDAYVSIDYGNQEVKIYTKDGPKISYRHIHVEKSTEPLKRELMNFIEQIRLPANQRQADRASRDALNVALDITVQIKDNFEALLTSSRKP